MTTDSTKVYVLFQDQLEAHSLTWEDIKENIPPFCTMIGTSSQGSFQPPPESLSHSCSTIQSFALDLARRNRLVKNEKTLFFNMEDVFTKIHLLLQKNNKEICGSPDTPISDVLDTFNKVKQAKLARQRLIPTDDNTDQNRDAANNYLKFTRATNLIDAFDLVNILSDALEEQDSDTKDMLQTLLPALVVMPRSDGKEPVKELFKVLFGENELQQVTVETSLDASLVGGEEAGPKSLQLEALELSDLVRSGSAKAETQIKSRTEQYVVEWAESYLRLLVNSRDELALGRLMCGPCGLLPIEVFNIIRKEADKVRMPIFQTIISYVNKYKLGSKTFAPKEDHPMFPYNKELVDFNDFMDKMQDRIEDEKTPSASVTKILSGLRSLSGKLNSTMSVASVEAAFKTLAIMSEEVMSSGEKQGDASKTPKRAVGAGGSLGGRKNLKAIRGLVDMLATKQKSPLNLHTLLGKLDPSAANGTALNVPSMSTVFTTPEATAATSDKSAAKDGDIETASLADRLGLEAVLNKDKPAADTAPVVATGAPRFQATLAWAQESSPAVLGSAERRTGPVRTFGVTLRAQGGKEDNDGTPVKISERVRDIVKEVDECVGRSELKEAEEELAIAVADAKKALPKPAKKPLKRSIFRDLGNINVPKTASIHKSVVTDNDDKNDEEKKKEPKSKKQKVLHENDTDILTAKEKKVKKTTTKKAPKPLLKGQMKMTTFLRM